MGYGHLVVGAAALVFAGSMIITARGPGAELGGVFLVPGIVLALAAAAFTAAALRVVARPQAGRAGPLSLILSTIELVAGTATTVGLVVATTSYGEIAPWRSPLLLPSVLLLALGVTGIRMEVAHRGRGSRPAR
ncbi:hypothetical protein [Phycicoccus sp. Soil748]|uniref:hypothetical protein n=1 Tax=Phycicoccus sp. Soil748 TaxID=1736397 RepID=UPI00070273A9|nr:hypothetical protein [Phycicoccus sp. Soil748]KRE53836.1 hypothetical protein ASG70_12155 [Phycicoccus sp. Soil748]